MATRMAYYCCYCYYYYSCYFQCPYSAQQIVLISVIAACNHIALYIYTIHHRSATHPVSKVNKSSDQPQQL
jgi:hypothetical protein